MTGSESTVPPTAPLREAMLVQYVFFALAQESAAGEVMHMPEAHLRTIVRQAVEQVQVWLGLPVQAGDMQIQPHPPEGSRVRIWSVYHSELLKDEAGHRGGFVDGRGHGDTLILEIGYGRRGPAGDAPWDELRAALWSPPADDPAYLGQALCYGGIVPEAGEADRQAMAALDPEAPGELRRCELPYGWLYDHPQAPPGWLADFRQPEALVLFYPDEGAEKRAEAFFHSAMPLLSLYAHQAAREYWDYERRLRPQLDESERTLARSLVAAAPSTSDLQVLEERLHAIATAYASFGNHLSGFEGRRQSVAIGVQNFDEALKRSELPMAGPLVARQAALQRWLGRLEADEGYYRALVRRAEITLRGLQAAAEIRRAQAAEEEAHAESRTNLWLAFIGFALGAGELITEKSATAFLAWLGLTAPQAGWPEGIIFATRLGLAFAFGLLGVGLAWAIQTLWRQFR